MSKVETTFKNKINEAFDNVIYVSGYKGSRSKSTVKLKCLLCGEVNHRVSGTARVYPSGRRVFRCDKCLTIHQPKRVIKDQPKETEVVNQGMTAKPVEQMNSYEKAVRDKINDIHEHLTYIGGYENEQSAVYIRCDLCGHIGKRMHGATKQYRIGRTSFVCEGCNHKHETTERTLECEVCSDTYKTRNIKGNVCEACIQAERQRINKEIARVNRERTLALLQPKRMIEWLIVRKNRLARNIERDKQRELARIDFETRVHTTECIHCKEAFDYIGHKETVCNECIRDNTRQLEYNRDKIRRKRMQKNGKYNSEIDLDAVIDRYDNVCYLCGGQCDKADHEWKSGVFYVGRNYPSIEHVIPISKGGTHTWDNVNLAHHYCNTIKSDTI